MKTKAEFGMEMTVIAIIFLVTLAVAGSIATVFSKNANPWNDKACSHALKANLFSSKINPDVELLLPGCETKTAEFSADDITDGTAAEDIAKDAIWCYDSFGGETPMPLLTTQDTFCHVCGIYKGVPGAKVEGIYTAIQERTQSKEDFEALLELYEDELEEESKNFVAFSADGTDGYMSVIMIHSVTRDYDRLEQATDGMLDSHQAAMGIGILFGTLQVVDAVTTTVALVSIPATGGASAAVMVGTKTALSRLKQATLRRTMNFRSFGREAFSRFNREGALRVLRGESLDNVARITREMTERGAEETVVRMARQYTTDDAVRAVVREQVERATRSHPQAKLVGGEAGVEAGIDTLTDNILIRAEQNIIHAGSSNRVSADYIQSQIDEAFIHNIDATARPAGRLDDLAEGLADHHDVIVKDAENYFEQQVIRNMDEWINTYSGSRPGGVAAAGAGSYVIFGNFNPNTDASNIMVIKPHDPEYINDLGCTTTLP